MVPARQAHVRMEIRMGLYIAKMATPDPAIIAEGQRLFDRFFEVSIDMRCVLSFNGYFTKVNPAWERTLGFTVEELTSRPFIEFVHPDDR